MANASVTNVDSDLHDLQAEMKQLRSDFSKVNDTLHSLARNGSNAAVTRAQAQAERAINGARGKVDEIGAMVEERPYASTLVAFGVGLIAGMIVNTRRH